MSTRDLINPPLEPRAGPHAAFGARFRALRLRMGMTLRACSITTGMSMMTISEIERGEIMPGTLDVWPMLEWSSGYIESTKNQEARNG